MPVRVRLSDLLKYQSAVNNELPIQTQIDLIDVITERPISINVGGKHYFLYQPSLGKILLIQKVMSEAGATFSDIPTLCAKRRRTCCKVVAYSVLCNRRQFFNSVLINELTDELDAGLSFEDLGKLMFVIKRQNDTKELEKALRMNEDDDNRRRVSKHKEEKGNSIVFGGRSIYGNFIDAACQRYGWTLDYLLWDISFANVHFMLKDAVNSVYLSDKEQKELHVYRTDSLIDGNDARNLDLIKKLTEE